MVTEAETEKVVSSHEAAGVLDVTPQTINNWARQGMKAFAQAGTSPAGHTLYNLRKLQEWARDNKGWVHGGKRKGAGRKAGLWAAAAAEAETPATPTTTVKGAELGDVETLESIDDLFRLAEEGRLPTAKVQALKALMDAKSKKLQYDLEAGVVVDAREQATVLARFLGLLRNRVEAMPGRLTGLICQDVGTTEHALIAKVRTRLQAEVDQWVKDVRTFAESVEGPINGEGTKNGQ